MASVALYRGSDSAPSCSGTDPTILPTLLGEDYGLYKTQKSTFVLSFLAHALLLVLLLVSGRYLAAHPREIRRHVVNIVTDIGPYMLPQSASKTGGGGGGGDREELSASKGALPRLSRQQLTPPAIIVRNENPKLPVEPTVVVPPEIHFPQAGLLGDPLSAVLAPSNGIGSGGGIGSGSDGGVGSGHGPGVGPGWGGGVGGGVYQIGGGVTSPRVIYAPDPEFSEEARKAKYQGIVVLSIVVGPDGRAHDIRIQRSLGLGLDEKAINAIRRWKFDPGRKDGTPVAVMANVEVSFRLF